MNASLAPSDVTSLVLIVIRYGLGIGLKGQDTRPQKRQYSIDTRDSTNPDLIEHRYTSGERELTVKAAALLEGSQVVVWLE